MGHKTELKWEEAKQKAIQTFMDQNAQQAHHVFTAQNAQLHINMRTNFNNKKVLIQIDLIIRSSNEIGI